MAASWDKTAFSTIFKCFPFGRTPNGLCQALFLLNFLSTYVFQGKFNPYIPLSFTQFIKMLLWMSHLMSKKTEEHFFFSSIQVFRVSFPSSIRCVFGVTYKANWKIFNPVLEFRIKQSLIKFKIENHTFCYSTVFSSF